MATGEVVHTLYRFFDASGSLLYVGRTVDARSRWRSHERTKAWFADVATVTRQVLPSADDLAAAELRAIATEMPIHNIQHNHHRPALVATPPRVATLDGDLFIQRRVALSGDVADAIEDCGDRYLENDCECRGCHRERMRFLDNLEEDFRGDEVVESAVARLRASYAAGDWLVEWLYDLFDVPMFRRVELTTFSRSVPAPAWCTPVDHGIEVGCPFCHDIHEHFLASGTPLGHTVLSTPCGGQYVPATDFDTQSDRYYGWLDSQALARAS